MPNENCISFGEVGAAQDAPVTPVNRVAREEAEAVSLLQREFATRQAEENTRVRDADAIAQTVTGRNYTGQRADIPTERKAREHAREFAKQIATTQREAQAENLRTAQGIMDLVRKTTVAGTNWFQNVKNKVYGTFVSDRAEVNKLLSHYADMAGMPEYANPLIAMFEQIPAVSRGLATKFARREENLLRELIYPLAQRTGMAVEDMALLAGHYACARHAPYRNQYLINHWRAEARRLGENTPDPSPATFAEIRELERRATVLERFRDSDLTDYDEREFGQFFSSGYTDRQAADTMAEILRKTGASKEELDAFSDRLTEEFNYRLSELAKHGLADENSANPELLNYVPMLSQRSEGFNNFTGAGNDTTPYNPGSFHAIEGRNNAPDSAWASLVTYSNRVATSLATRDFGYALNALELHLASQGVQSPLKSVSYGKIMDARHGGSPLHNAMANALYNRGGMVVKVPRRQPDGTTRMEKRFFAFVGRDMDHMGAHFSTEKLNKALSADFKLAEPGPIVGALSRATSVMGQLTTRFPPLFAPVSGSRDFMERLINMANRTYYTTDGRALQGANLLGEYAANVPQAGNILLNGMRGRLAEGSEAQRWYNEFVDHGLNQQFTMRSHVSDRSLAEVLAGDDSGIPRSLANRIPGLDTPNLNRAFNSFGRRKADALRVVDGWNDYWQNFAAMAQYITLRKNGVSADQAASSVLREMNMSLRGSIAPWLQALAPFVVPTVQSGTALMRTLGFGARNARGILSEGIRGYAAIAIAGLAYSVLSGLARDSMGVDENGESRYDALSFDELTRALPIGVGNAGEYVRFPIGFGPAQLGAMLSVGFQRVSEGRMDPSDLMFELMFGVMKNVAPGNWPSYNFSEHPTEFIMSMLTPNPFRPLMEVNQNLDYFGNPIYTDSLNQESARSTHGQTGTPRVFHNVANSMRETIGLDLEPEIYEHAMRSYMLGPLRAITAFARQADQIYRGSDRPSVLDEVHPALAAMGITSWMGKVPNASRSMYYEAKRKYEARIRELGVDLAAPKGEDGEQWRRRQLEGLLPQRDIDNYIALWRGQADLQKLSRQFNQEYKDRWLNMDSSTELKNAFDKLADDSNKIYENVLTTINGGGFF